MTKLKGTSESGKIVFVVCFETSKEILLLFAWLLKAFEYLKGISVVHRVTVKFVFLQIIISILKNLQLIEIRLLYVARGNKLIE